MPPKQNGETEHDLQDADFAKAFQELNRGEQTATALENHLAALGSKDRRTSRCHWPARPARILFYTIQWHISQL
ncbi:unnamed protein product [Aureobasidium mustum]|uniref:Uncharacterized protein n=1 Tax=Aureobasidium mustum TaxID=2773714 RepID=A0A9N8PH40_9PEZI|nr:unnamed protein product [Aureobasidium mustum]